MKGRSSPGALCFSMLLVMLGCLPSPLTCEAASVTISKISSSIEGTSVTSPHTDSVSLSNLDETNSYIVSITTTYGVGEPTGWVSLSLPNIVTIPAGGRLICEIAADASDLEVGEHDASVLFSVAETPTNELAVSVSMAVLPSITLSVSQASLNESGTLTMTAALNSKPSGQIVATPSVTGRYFTACVCLLASPSTPLLQTTFFVFFFWNGHFLYHITNLGRVLTNYLFLPHQFFMLLISSPFLRQHFGFLFEFHLETGGRLDRLEEHPGDIQGRLYRQDRLFCFRDSILHQFCE